MTNPIERIEALNYGITDAELRALGETFAGVSAISSDIGTTMLRVFVKFLGSDEDHKPGDICRNCVDDGWRAITRPFEAGFRACNGSLSAKEINRRLTFLRSIKSTVKAWWAAGGDPVKCVLDGHHLTVTKSALVASTGFLRGSPTTPATVVGESDDVRLGRAASAAVGEMFASLRAMGECPARIGIVALIKSELDTQFPI